MTSVADRTANADRSYLAVLCGVEALSAQQWVVGVDFVLRGSFHAERPNGTASSEKNLRSHSRSSRELKGEG